MKKRNEKRKQAETDIKIPLILSFILMIGCIGFAFNKNKFHYWGIHESIIGVGKIGVFGILVFYLALFIMILIFIFFQNRVVHWISLCLIFGILFFYSLNSGFCMTKSGVYEREWGKTVFHSFKEIETFQKKKGKSLSDNKKYYYIIHLKNGEEFSFRDKNVDEYLLLKSNYLKKYHHPEGLYTIPQDNRETKDKMNHARQSETREKVDYEVN